MLGPDGHGGGGRRRWRLNPFEVAVCGYKNTGKTTLLEGIARALAGELRLAYLKHDAHHFTMDHAGKDTDRLREAGASSALITGAAGFGHVGRDGDSEVLAPYPLLAADALLVEGFKGSDLPRIVLLDEKLAIVDELAGHGVAPVAIACPWPSHSREASAARACVRQRFGDLPWFERDDLAGITELVRELWRRRVPPLRGLLLTGGRSTRMGRDKALLDYHGRTQIDHGVGLLAQLCPEVQVSCHPDQDGEAVRQRHGTLPDRFLDMGPTGGILTALAARAGGDERAYLVLACDLPRVDAELLGRLVAARNPFRFATAWRDADGFPQPLCTIWEPKAYPRLLQFVGMGRVCPRKCLSQSPIALLDAPDAHALDNGNTPEDRRRIHHDLHPRS